MEELLVQLQQDADTRIATDQLHAPWVVGVLGRLRDYVAIAINPLKLRVRSMAIHVVTTTRIEIRVAGSSVLQLIFAPAELMVGEIVFLRQAALKKLVTPQIIVADISYNLIPVGVLVCAHTAGVPLCDVSDEPMLRIGARQVGRQLRILHTQPMPGWGAPSILQKWESADWRGALQHWVNQTTAVTEFGAGALHDAMQRVWHELISDDYLRDLSPVCLHGDVTCHNVYVTVHSHVQLEGIVRPGMLVAGDAMFDLACVMRGHVVPALRQGVVEGYTATLPLRSEEIARIKRMTMLWRIVDLLRQTHIVDSTLASSIHAALDTLR